MSTFDQMILSIVVSYGNLDDIRFQSGSTRNPSLDSAYAEGGKAYNII